MSYLQSIILGIIQGLTEFLPVSSSGHLVLAQEFLQLQSSQNITFEVFLHLGTLFAVLLYYRKMLWEMTVSVFSFKDQDPKHRDNRRLVFYLIVATFATGVIYLTLGHYFEALFQKPLVVAFMLLITGGLVFASDYMKEGTIRITAMGWLRAAFIGLMQGIAIIPGISRSGSTISASLFAGIKREDAASFSFLLSIIAILAANLKEFKSLQSLNTQLFFIYLTGMLCAFISGYLVISLMIKLIQKSKLKYFAYYCWAAGLLSIFLLVR